MGFLEAPPVSKADVVKYAGEQVNAARGKDWRRGGALSTDFTTFVQSSTPDATLTQQYLLGNNSSIPSTHPLDQGGVTMKALTNAFGYAESEYPLLAGRVMRFMTDAPKVAVKFGYASSGYAWQAYIDGAPVTADPVVGNGALYLQAVFPTSGRARLIEVMTKASFGSMYVAPPYRIWKPDPLPAPKILVMGDSYAMTTSYNDSGVEIPYEFGIYHRMRADLGITNMLVDGVGGSGYIQRNAGGIGGPNNSYLDRLPSALALNPDVLVMHGGGANDLFYGNSVADIIEGATDLFQAARAARPNAKLVFIEGFKPPVGFPTFGDEYIAIRQGVQANCMAQGVYYVDVETTSPWISGTGKYGATTGAGNSDIYIGPDGIHLMAKGSDYIRSRMAAKLRTILADNGLLVNTLV